MSEVLLNIHFNEGTNLTPEDATALVNGVFQRVGDGLTLVERDNYPRTYDTQDVQVDVLVEVDETVVADSKTADTAVAYARQALNQELVLGEGASAHHISGCVR